MNGAFTESERRASRRVVAGHVGLSVMWVVVGLALVVLMVLAATEPKSVDGLGPLGVVAIALVLFGVAATKIGALVDRSPIVARRWALIYQAVAWVGFAACLWFEPIGDAWSAPKLGPILFVGAVNLLSCTVNVRNPVKRLTAKSPEPIHPIARAP